MYMLQERVPVRVRGRIRIRDSLEVLMSATATVTSREGLDNTLPIRIRSESYAIRSHICQAAALSLENVQGEKFMIIVGVGRFQEWEFVDICGIAVDEHFVPPRFMRRRNIPLNEHVGLARNLASLSRKSGSVMHANMTLQRFFECQGSAAVLAHARMGNIAFVMCFSMQHVMPLVKTLVDAGASVFGCLYVHDDVLCSGVLGSPPATMTYVPGSDATTAHVIAVPRISMLALVLRSSLRSMP